MLWTIALSLAMGQGAPTGFGPATVAFPLTVQGNPFDPDANDVRVRFVQGPKTEERLAYFDADGKWKAVLRAGTGGVWDATALHNGKVVAEKFARVTLNPCGDEGFVRRHPKAANRFVLDNGGGYYPIGHNIGWQGPNQLELTEQIALLGKSGGNWTRIWACHWDGKNPWWKVGDLDAARDRFWFEPIQRWDALIAACERSGVRAQFVLFHHGQWTTRVNPNWSENPWNKANGGFLESPTEFFTNAEAKQRAKRWLRYAVARWGHSPAVMAWELFNEVEWVEARYADRWDTIEAWHGEMADFIRSLDPYRHLVTTSSPMEREKLWVKMDFYQPHTYPPDIEAAIAGEHQPGDKPLFFGEFGGAGAAPLAGGERGGIRDGIWAAALANQGGAGQYWFWDRLQAERELYSEYRIAADVFAAAELWEHASAKPVALPIESPGKTDLVFAPGLGWAPSKTTELNLPQDVVSGKHGMMSSYFQSSKSNNAAMFPGPLSLRFKSEKPGEARIQLGQISAGGADVGVYLNGKLYEQRTFRGGSGDRRVREVIVVPFEAGANHIELRNTGADWVVVSQIRIPGLGPTARARALAESDWMFARVKAMPGTTRAVLGPLPLAAGTYQVQRTDLDTGLVRKNWHRLARGARLTLDDLKADEAVLIRKGEE